MLFPKKRMAIVKWARARAKLGNAQQIAKAVGLNVAQVYEITRADKKANKEKHAFSIRHMVAL